VKFETFSGRDNLQTVGVDEKVTEQRVEMYTLLNWLRIGVNYWLCDDSSEPS
jgi:hypothetical protein